MSYNYIEHKRQVVRAWEIQRLTEIMDENEGSIARAARAIGMTRENLKKKLRDLGLMELSTAPHGGDRRSLAFLAGVRVSEVVQ